VNLLHRRLHQIHLLDLLLSILKLSRQCHSVIIDFDSISVVADCSL
jgi:hypothetical protein